MISVFISKSAFFWSSVNTSYAFWVSINLSPTGFISKTPCSTCSFVKVIVLILFAFKRENKSFFTFIMFYKGGESNIFFLNESLCFVQSLFKLLVFFRNWVTGWCISSNIIYFIEVSERNESIIHSYIVNHSSSLSENAPKLHRYCMHSAPYVRCRRRHEHTDTSTATLVKSQSYFTINR